MPDTTRTRERFESFLNAWLARQSNFVEELICASSPDGDDCNAQTTEQQRRLVDEVLCHYRQYYEEKSAAAGEDAYVFFSPPWLSSYEKILLWVGGFKSSLAFKLVSDSVDDLTAEQEERMERVKVETKREERELVRAVARLQESVADPPLMILARRFGRLVDGEVSEMDRAMDAFKAEMAVVLERADALRCSTVGKMVEILSPAQAMRFLTAAGQFQLRTRRFGLQRDQERASN